MLPKRLDDSLVLLDVGVAVEHLARQKRRMSALQLGERDDALRGGKSAMKSRVVAGFARPRHFSPFIYRKPVDLGASVVD
jgi:hypothetical protein